MTRIKPYIIGFVIGAIATVVIAGAAITAVYVGKPLIKKAMGKISDRRFANVKKAEKDFIIADFEAPGDLEKFMQVDSEASLSGDFASAGKQSAKVKFKPASAPAFKIGEYFEKDKSFSDWAPYESFAFDIYNPQKDALRLILQIKDKSGEKHKQSITVEPDSWGNVEVEVISLRKHLSVYNIAQINLFQWNPRKESVCYVDNMRLVSAGKRVEKSIFSPEFANTASPIYAVGGYLTFNKDKWRNEAGYCRFPLHILNPGRVRLHNFPAQGGIPFPKGELNDKDSILIKDGTGQAAPFQSKVLAKWSDGSIKWLLLHIPVTVEYANGSQYFLEYAYEAKEPAEERLAVESSEGITVDTGKIKFFISKKDFKLFDKIRLNDEEINAGNGDLTLQFRKKVYRSSQDKNYILTLEDNGPLAATIKAEGWFVGGRGEKFCKFLVRIRAYKNKSYVRVFHTFIYTGYPENKEHYLYKGKRLPKNETIEDIGIDLNISGIDLGATLAFGADNKVYEAPAAGFMKALQGKHDYFEYTEGTRTKVIGGSKLDGWLDFSDGKKGICVIVRKLWQQFPKGFEIDKKTGLLSVKLWPKEAGALDLRTTERATGPDSVARGSAFGLAKTHEMVLYFHRADYNEAKVQNLALTSQEPPLIIADPLWFSGTHVLGALSDYNSGINYFKKYEDCVERLFDWGYRQQRTFKWYGMVDFGDVLTDYSLGELEAATDESGWYRHGRYGWHNCSVTGLHLGSFLQFLRTGLYKYFEFGEDTARHIMDIDTCHYNTVANDKRLKRSIPDDYSRVGSMHRHNADHWGDRNEMAGYTNLNGILLYYYLTGDERAFDVAKEAGEFFLSHPVTYFRHPDIAPGRAIANVLWGEVALYEATQDERLKKDADYWANLFFNGQNRNGSWNEDYNPVTKRWDGEPHMMYMTGYIVPALVKYHELTDNKAIADSIVKLTDYLIKKDKYYPFFEGLSHSYYLTGEKKYLDAIEERLSFFDRSQRKQEDPLWNGMIFQKLTYTRMAYFVYSIPYAFDALLDRARAGKEERIK